MRIAFLSPGWPSSSFPNGIVFYLERLMPALILQGVDVKVLAFSNAQHQNVTDVIALDQLERSLFRNIINKIMWQISPTMTNRVVTAQRIVAGLNEISTFGQLDVLEMIDSFGFAADIAPKVTCPIVVRLHGPHCIVGKVAGKEGNKDFTRRVKQERLGIQAADAITAPSLDVLERVRNYYGIKLDNARVIPNPVGVVDEQNYWNCKTYDTNTILFVGRFDLVKGGDILIKAFNIVLKKNNKAKLIFVGPDRGITDTKGKKWNGPDYAKHVLGKNSNKENLSWKGHLDQKQICKLRQQATVTVVCSRYESFSYVVLEAMSQGCPLICADVGGIKEIVKDETNGLLFENGNHYSLAEKILLLLKDSEKSKKLGANALKHVNKEYNPVDLAKKTIHFYEELMLC